MTSLVDPARLRELFDSLATTVDASSDYTEPVIERATIVSMLDKHMSAEGGDRDAIARQLFSILDDDGDGIVTFEEFCLAYDVHPLEMVSLRLRFAFCVLIHWFHSGHS
jgi:Ca2+-binding EF-hand superfamily protein